MGRTRWRPIALAAVLVLTAAGCGDDDNDPAEQQGTAARPTVRVTATDYGFELPATISGGPTDLTLDNTGQELHFAAFAQAAEGKTVADVKAALTGLASGQPPAGAPPFVEYMALGTVDPGGQSRMTVDLPAGNYVLFCMVPTPEGVPHAVKGMMRELAVTAGPDGDLPATDSTVLTFDFAVGDLPAFEAGQNTVTLENRGKQIHELDLVELPEGKKVEDLKAWAAQPAGPPPARFLGGPAIRDGVSATTTFDLKAGARYAIVCIIPDSLGDGAPHITKGMHSPEFQVKA